jgi:hypothetical protein
MKRKCLAVGIILLFVGVTITPAIAQNTKKSQSTSKGNWLYVGGSGPGNYTRIQDAINNSNDGDTVFVYSGWYNNSKLYINKSIFVYGEGRDTTFIVDKNLSLHACVSIYHNNVVFNGFSVLHDYWGIGIYKCKDVQISKNYIEHINNNGQGITIANANSIILSNNTVCHHAVGFFIDNSKNIMIKDNVIDGTEQGDRYSFDGIDIRFSKKITITRNTIQNYQQLYQYGLTIYRGHFTIVRENNFLNNTHDSHFANSFFTVWQRNYWNQTLTSPKAVPGSIVFIRTYGPMELPYKKYDWHPAQEPYDIPGMS